MGSDILGLDEVGLDVVRMDKVEWLTFIGQSWIGHNGCRRTGYCRKWVLDKSENGQTGRGLNEVIVEEVAIDP